MFIYNDIQKTNMDDAQILQDFAQQHIVQAENFVQTNQWGEALHMYEQAHSVLDAVALRQPDNVNIKQTLNALTITIHDLPLAAKVFNIMEKIESCEDPQQAHQDAQHITSMIKHKTLQQHLENILTSS